MSSEGSDTSADIDQDISSYFRHGAADSAPLSTIASAMMFGTILFATVGMATRSWLIGDNRALLVALNPRASSLNTKSFESLFALLFSFSVFGLILFVAYICEYHPPFPHSSKSYDRDEFFFLTAIMFLASAFTVTRNEKEAHPKGATMTSKKKKNLELIQEDDSASIFSTRSEYYIEAADTSPDNDVLNRNQTEEWKGWMQFIFLMYHYYHAEEVYNSIRIMITCYVWMTGFGNFSFFYLKGDYSFVRVIQMLWRLNFLVSFLCLTQGTTYILYYICPLHTYFFFMVYITMRVAKHVNYTKYGLRVKLACLALGIYFLWDLDSGLFSMLHMFLGTEPKLGATSGTMWEWYFRSSLDHWSTFLGMLFALNFPITSLFFRKLEAHSRMKCFIGKFVVGVALLAAFGIWLIGPFQNPKKEYNQTNAYYGFIPLMTFIYFRNLTPSLRSYSLNFLHEIGKTTLETYLMQHHIWLTSNAKSLLTIIPGWPKVNMLVVTIFYFFTSRKLYKLTLYLRGMLLPDDRNKCISSMFGLGTVVALFYAVAFVLQMTGHISLMAMAVVSIVCGFLLYQTVMDLTWTEFQEESNKEKQTDDNSPLPSQKKNDSESSIARMSPPIIGTMIVLIIGILWQGMAMTGAGKIKPLHAGCDAYVNDGMWIPVNGCNEESRGSLYREEGITSLATCNPNGGAFVWGWKETKSFTHCRFARRETKELKKTLRDRSVVFVGDSTTRNLFHATCRSLGIKKAGAYDASIQKHSDIAITIGDIEISFRWAPLAVDQLSVLKEFNEASTQSLDNQFDLIVMGGGAWDRLHVYATDEDQESHKSTVKLLTKEITASNALGSPVAWLIPTAINTAALNTEEKRDHMKEEDMEAIRAVYASLGILSSSAVVIDGPAFTKDRVHESYDGVHYPLQVYDAGAQILANSLDWVLPKKSVKMENNTPPSPGAMSQPFLGLMMLCFTAIALLFFDGFMGFSYAASFFVGGVMPSQLYEEAFYKLHKKMKLPNIPLSSNDSVASYSMVSKMSGSNGSSKMSNGSSKMRNDSSSTNGSNFKQRKKVSRSKDNTIDEEIASLLSNDNSK